MATVFVVLVLLTFVGNAIVTRSRTQWWRDPGSLFRAESEPEPQPVPQAVPQAARVRQPWEVTPREEVTRHREVTPYEEVTRHREVTPREEVTRHREVTPHREVAVQSSPRAGRHAMRSDVAVPIEHAETELIARIPGGRLRHERYSTR